MGEKSDPIKEELVGKESSEMMEEKIQSILDRLNRAGELLILAKREVEKIHSKRAEELSTAIELVGGCVLFFEDLLEEAEANAK